MKKLTGNLILRIMGWKVVGERPPTPCVCVCAPHTSNWDFVLMIAVAWSLGFKLSFLGKDSLFKGPLGVFMKWCGGVPVDRSTPGGLVEQLATNFEQDDELVLGVPAEGTRGHRDHWKSGFYRIAERANAPIVLAFVDAETKTTGIGPNFMASGDIGSDMDTIREFYSDKIGWTPENKSVIYLREEDPEPTAEAG